MSKSPSIQCISQIFSKKSPDIISGICKYPNTPIFSDVSSQLFVSLQILGFTPRYLSSISNSSNTAIVPYAVFMLSPNLQSGLWKYNSSTNIHARRAVYSCIYIYSFRFSHLGMPLLTNLAGFLHCSKPLWPPPPSSFWIFCRKSWPLRWHLLGYYEFQSSFWTRVWPPPPLEQDW